MGRDRVEMKCLRLIVMRMAMMSMLILPALGAGTVSDARAAGFTWHVSHAKPAKSFGAVSCPSRKLCVALTLAGQLLSTTDPAAGHPVWKLAKGIKVTAPEDFESTAVFNLSCPSVKLCVTSDEGAILTSTRPAAGAASWHSRTLTMGQINALSCPKITYCVAINDQDNPSTGDGNPGTFVSFLSSTDPAAPAAVWHATGALNPIGATDYMSNLSCAGPALCAGGDDDVDVDGSIHPANVSTWHLVGRLTSALDGIACPTRSLCVGAEDQGELATSTHPISVSSWHTATLQHHHFISNVACAGASFCAGVGEDNTNHTAVLTTSHPARGAAGWTYTVLHARGATFLRAISCASPSFCVAVGDGGYVAVGTRSAKH